MKFTLAGAIFCQKLSLYLIKKCGSTTYVYITYELSLLEIKTDLSDRYICFLFKRPCISPDHGVSSVFFFLYVY